MKAKVVNMTRLGEDIEIEIIREGEPTLKYKLIPHKQTGHAKQDSLISF